LDGRFGVLLGEDRAEEPAKLTRENAPGIQNWNKPLGHSPIPLIDFASSRTARKKTTGNVGDDVRFATSRAS
jgi:hypothetical protein